MAAAVEMVGISKYFPSTNVLANQNVSLAVRQAEVHALVGENGAGKTTLMNILFGLQQPDTGKILVAGQEVRINTPLEAIQLGINMVHQHFKLVPSFTVAQNILLGQETTKAGLTSSRRENQIVRDLAETYGLPIDPAARVSDLPVGLQQRVEILKALQRNAKILLLDEPTAVLTPQESRELFVVVRRLAERGCTVVFISHKLPEVLAVANRVTVMRQGKIVATSEVSETSIPELARQMVGREVLFRVKKLPAQPGSSVLKVDRLAVADSRGLPAVIDVSFTVRQGEILGVAGVNGNGQSELVEAIAGMRRAELGEIDLCGTRITNLSVGKRRSLGLAHIPEDRMGTGLNLQTSIDENIIGTQSRSSRVSRYGFLLSNGIQALTAQLIARFSVAAARPGEGVHTLSGGNLQKVVLGRELAGEPDLIIANEPTRGLDVGSIEFVHKTLIEARDRGAAVLLVSVDLDEILSLSDRVIVMYRGRIAGELDGADISEERLGILMAGGTIQPAEVTAHA